MMKFYRNHSGKLKKKARLALDSYFENKLNSGISQRDLELILFVFHRSQNKDLVEKALSAIFTFANEKDDFANFVWKRVCKKGNIGGTILEKNEFLSPILNYAVKVQDIDLMWKIYRKVEGDLEEKALSAINAYAKRELNHAIKEQRLFSMWRTWKNAPRNSKLNEKILSAILNLAVKNQDPDILVTVLENCYKRNNISDDFRDRANSAINSLFKKKLKIAIENKDKDLLLEIFNKAPNKELREKAISELNKLE